MNKATYSSINEIKQDLKILKLKRDISYELLHQNKEDFEELMTPMTLLNKFLSPVKKIGIAYLLKKIF
ncbi:DUF6327 family protein [uncultured Winogradskyella sp.]|uniref:DUF6327 family protein n=1 Tax=uncultured Winogradskyella sp. TaxID=395353 RepID=UPI00344C5165